MLRCRWWMGLAMAGAAAFALWLTPHLTRAQSDTALESALLDPMTGIGAWRVGGERVSYSLGASAVAVSPDHPREGFATCLALEADFKDPGRDRVSALFVGEPTWARCRALSLWVWSEGSPARLSITIEDAEANWFEKDVTALDWQGWRKIEVAVGDGGGWTPLLRADEAPRSLTQPVAVRGLVVARAKGGDGDPMNGMLTTCFSELRAQANPGDLDRLDGVVSTGRVGNLFVGDEPVKLKLTLRNRGDRPVTGVVQAEFRPFEGAPLTVELGSIGIPVGQVRSRDVTATRLTYGPYRVVCTMTSGAARRSWAANIAVARSTEVADRTGRSRLGCCGNLEGFSGAEAPAVARLNRIGGMGWARVGLSWEQVNPAPDVWTWDPIKRVEGPVGRALRTGGRLFRASDNRGLDAEDEVTVAFWARLDGPNGRWQTPISKWGEGHRRNYGVYFHRDTGNFVFSAGYEKRPGAFVDFDSGVSAWNGRWRHFAATYSRHIKQVSLYVDGQIQASSFHDGGRLLATDAPVLIGADCPCDLDEVLIYSRALGPADIAALARKSPPPQDGLVGWWRFDEPQGAAVNHAGSGSLETDEPDGIRSARQARAQGMQPLVILGFPPDWASTAPDPTTDEGYAARPWVHAPNLKAWSAYVENLTRQYRGLVDYWEIWNEPNVGAFWEPRPDPARYLPVLKAAYAAAKRGNPRCTVVMPGLSGPREGRIGMDYLERLLQLGGGRYCDAISIHPYRSRSPEDSRLVADLDHIARTCASHGPARPIWITENCWSTELRTGSSERRQAAMLARSYILAIGSGLVDRLIWFRLHDSGPDRLDAEHNYGLCRTDLTPKPAFFAHRTIAVLLGRARRLSSARPERSVYVETFLSAGERLAALWTTRGSRWVALSVGRPELQVTDLMGNSSMRKTDGGVLLLHAGDVPTFARHLPARVEWTGDLLSAKCGAIPAGGTATAIVAVRNPYRTALRAPLRFSVEGVSGMKVEPSSAVARADPQGRASVTVKISAPAGSSGGAATLVTRALLHETPIEERVPVRVR